MFVYANKNIFFRFYTIDLNSNRVRDGRSINEKDEIINYYKKLVEKLLKNAKSKIKRVKIMCVIFNFYK